MTTNREFQYTHTHMRARLASEGKFSLENKTVTTRVANKVRRASNIYLGRRSSYCRCFVRTARHLQVKIKKQTEIPSNAFRTDQ